MKKELLETIDTTIENICRWANKEFEEKKPLNKTVSRDMLIELAQDTKRDNKDFNTKIKIIQSISNLLQARAVIESTLPIQITNGNNKYFEN